MYKNVSAVISYAYGEWYKNVCGGSLHPASNQWYNVQASTPSSVHKATRGSHGIGSNYH